MFDGLPGIGGDGGAVFVSDHRLHAWHWPGGELHGGLDGCGDPGVIVVLRLFEVCNEFSRCGFFCAEQELLDSEFLIEVVVQGVVLGFFESHGILLFGVPPLHKTPAASKSDN